MLRREGKIGNGIIITIIMIMYFPQIAVEQEPMGSEFVPLLHDDGRRETETERPQCVVPAPFQFEWEEGEAESAGLWGYLEAGRVVKG